MGHHAGMMDQHKQEWWVNIVRNLQHFSFFANLLTAVQVRDQYEEGGIRNVNPADATGLALGTTGLTASGLSYLGIAPQTMSSIAGFSGVGGLAVGTYQNWMAAFKIMYNTNLPPAYSGDQQYVEEDFLSDFKQY